MASSVEAEPWNRAWASESLCDLGLHSGLGLSPLPLRGCHYRGTYEALGGSSMACVRISLKRRMKKLLKIILV